MVENPISQFESVLETSPYQDLSSQKALTQLAKECGITGLTFVKRESWDANNFLASNLTDANGLTLPEDIHLFELPYVTDKLRGALSNSPFGGNSVQQDLGTLFHQTAVYLARRSPSLKYTVHNKHQDSPEIAESRIKKTANDLALNFEQYSRKILGDTDNQPVSTESLQSEIETEEQQVKIDRWLAGPTLYKGRKNKLDAALVNSINSPDVIQQKAEELRLNTLSQFFTAFDLSLQERDEEHPREYRDRFLAKVDFSLVRAAMLPRRELSSTIAEHGKTILKDNIKIANLAPHLNLIGAGSELIEKTSQAFDQSEALRTELMQNEERYKLIKNFLNIEEMKRELDEASDPQTRGKLEYEFTRRIQRAIENLPYNKSSNTPQTIITNQARNCFGATLLGTAFLDELGINYLLIASDSHSSVLTFPADGRIIWTDMQGEVYNHELRDEDLQPRFGEMTSLDEIRKLGNASNYGQRVIRVTPKLYHRNTFSVPAPDTTYDLYLTSPKDGGKLAHIITNISRAENSDFGPEDIELLEFALDIRPDDLYILNKLATKKLRTTEYRSAIEYLRRALDIDPHNSTNKLLLEAVTGQI